MKKQRQKPENSLFQPMVDAPPKELANALKRRIASAAGADYFQDRDPIYHVSESFSHIFDMMGAQKAANSDSKLFETWMHEIVPGLYSEARQQADGKASQEHAETRFLEQTGMDNMFEPSPGKENDRFMNRFSEIAFQRGNMSAAVMRGTGQMMLFSCLKRTIGQSQPKNFRQRKLFQSGSVLRNVGGNPPDKVLFNRGAVDGAVGVVVDVLRDGRRVIDTLIELAGGENILPEGSGAQTLLRMYPFLSESQELALLTSYKEKLATGGLSAPQRVVLKRAEAKTQALLEKKQQMRFRFMMELRKVSDNASAALTVFNQEGFTQALYIRLEEYAPPPEPPDDRGDEENGEE